MRVTQTSVIDNLINNINNNYKRLSRVQEQLSTGKSILLPSDDPAAVGTVLRTKRSINEAEQFISNAEKGASWLDLADSALAEATSVLHRAKELLVRGANGTNADAERNIIATEVDELLEHLVSIANSNIGGRHIFAGQKTLEKPFTYDKSTRTITYNGDSKQIMVEIAPGISETISVPGIEIFGKADTPGDDGIFAMLIKASDALKNGDDLDPHIGGFDKAIESLLQRQAFIGTKSQGMSLIKERLEEQKINLNNLLSETYYVDVAKASIELMAAANVHTMALKVGAKIIQPSLVDFLV
jgi:flagellar hook-associated protein 3 FlgL